MAMPRLKTAERREARPGPGKAHLNAWKVPASVLLGKEGSMRQYQM